MTGPIVLVLRLLAAAALYAFLALILWMTWQEIRRTERAAGRPKAPPIRLEIRTRSQRQVARMFTGGEIIIGRDPLSDLPLQDKAVSARHARLSYHDGQWWIDDLGSTNGTRLNRVPIERATVLTGGDEIKCGGVRVLVLLPDESTGPGGQDE